MTPERWEQIKGLFHEALEHDPADRATFLVQVCCADASLREQVEALIASHEQAGDFIETPASDVAAALLVLDQSGLTPGQILGPFRIKTVLAKGGMGQVYLAEDTRLGRPVALKLLPTQFTADPDRVRRFEQEARAASALNHPNIVTIHEIGQSDSLHFIATEFVNGKTLREHLKSKDMTVGEVLDVGVQIAAALEAAHKEGIVHRDIKPDNIMVRHDHVVKVLDFGLAKLMPQEVQAVETMVQTNPGVVMGTVAYMSPEQARGQDADTRTDIWSLGVVLYEMVTGQAPFTGETPSHVIVSILEAEPSALSHDPEVPAELIRIVARALCKEKSGRYESVSLMALDLKNLKEDLTVETRLKQFRRLEAHSGDIPIGSDVATRIGNSKFTNSGATKTTASIERREATKQWRIGFVVAAVVLIVVGLITVVSLSRRRERTLSANQSGRRSGRALTIRNGYITSARFAPDGKGVIYGAGFDGRPVEVFATDIEGSESRPIGIPSAALKDFSASGELAVLLNFELSWNDGRNGTLALVPATGGEPRVLMEGVDEATFAPDGKTLAIVRPELGQHQLEYPAGQVLYKSLGWISYPRFSRQGDKIAFFEHPLGDNSGAVLVLDLKSKETKSLSSGWRALKGLAWSATGDEIWFGGSKVSKKQNINGVSLTGQERLNIYDMTSYAKLEDISREGRLLVSHGNTHTTMVVLGENSPGEGLRTRFAWSTSADISADGQALLFYEWGWESGAQVEVKSTYLRRLDGSDPVRLGEGRALALSADGNWALAVQEKSLPQLVLLPTHGGKSTELPNRGFKEYHYGSWFPDGRRILFTALEAGEEAFLRSYVQDIETGVVHPVTEEGTVALRVSPDGKKVVALDPYGSYSIHSIEGGASDTPIEGLERGDEPIQWSADGRALYVRGPGDFATKLYRVEIASGRRRVLKEIVPSNSVGLAGIEVKPGGIVITPDGKVCVYTYWTTLEELLLMDEL